MIFLTLSIVAFKEKLWALISLLSFALLPYFRFLILGYNINIVVSCKWSRSVLKLLTPNS